MIVYAVTDGAGHVKVGHTRDLLRRLNNLQTGCPVELRVLATEEADLSLERALHRALAQYWTRGEWFSVPGWVVVMLAVEPLSSLPRSMMEREERERTEAIRSILGGHGYE